MVATFLAMLELIKANKITVDDTAENPTVNKVEGASENDEINLSFGGESDA